MIKICLTAAALLAFAPAALSQPLEPGPACALLGDLVKQRVHLAAIEVNLDGPVPVARRLPTAEPVMAIRHVCRRTVEATTRAFGEALAGLNMPIGWEPAHPGGYCRGGDLSHCYPGAEPGNPRMPASRLAFVHDAWQGVRDAVQTQMPEGSARGVSVFTRSSLDSALAASLGHRVEGPLHSSYPTTVLPVPREGVDFAVGPGGRE